mmetsp:Transcript_26264/g.56347  ORF Transcript_26264/g.56347 Transcript_26264/m.56347 type:complete len:324 (+) Transcript_26264:1569-2540(+)
MRTCALVQDLSIAQRGKGGPGGHLRRRRPGTVCVEKGRWRRLRQRRRRLVFGRHRQRRLRLRPPRSGIRTTRTLRAPAAPSPGTLRGRRRELLSVRQAEPTQRQRRRHPHGPGGAARRGPGGRGTAAALPAAGHRSARSGGARAVPRRRRRRRRSAPALRPVAAGRGPSDGGSGARNGRPGRSRAPAPGADGQARSGARQGRTRAIIVVVVVQPTNRNVNGDVLWIRVRSKGVRTERRGRGDRWNGNGRQRQPTQNELRCGRRQHESGPRSLSMTNLASREQRDETRCIALHCIVRKTNKEANGTQRNEKAGATLQVRCVTMQ